MNRKTLLVRSMALAALAVALLPALRIARILWTNGVDVPSNDETALLPRFLGAVLQGHYNWLHFPRDAFLNGHLLALPSLVYIALAKFDRLHLYPALFGALVLDFASLLLFYGAATFRSRSRSPVAAAALLPLLAILLFSVTTISVYEFPLQSMVAGFNLFGFALGIWALMRWPGQTRAVLLASAGGLIAAISYASGLSLVFIFLVCMAVLGFKRKTDYAIAGSAALIAIALYAYLVISERSLSAGLGHFFNPGFVVSALGRPFSNNLNSVFAATPFTRFVGALGLVFLAFGLFAARRQVWSRPADYLPALGIAAFGLLSLIQISMFRDLLAPWYTGLAMYVWIAVAALAYLLWTGPREQKQARSKVQSLAAPLVILAVILVLFLYSNRSYSDKSFLLKNRSPASAASLRNFDTAPTYCQQLTASWIPGRVGSVPEFGKLASILRRHGLSVFAPHQEWTLQGDSVLESVRYHSGPLGTDAGWAPGLAPDFQRFTDYRHLNLLLNNGAFVEWTITLPENTRSAALVSSAARTGGSVGQPIHQVRLYDSSGQEQQVVSISTQLAGRWYPFSIALDAYAGKRVTLRLSSSGGQAWAVYRYPRIDLDVSGPGDASETAAAAPSNTDLSPSFQPVGQTDYRFDLNAPDQWTTEGLQSKGNEWKVTSHDPSITNVQALNIGLEEYSKFYVKMSASADQVSASFYAVLVTRRNGELPVAHQVLIPLLADNRMHPYTFPLRLLNLGDSRLVGVSLHPAQDPGLVPKDAVVSIAETGLIHAHDGWR